MSISQTELGKQVGLSRQTISLVERGIVSLSWNNYLTITMFIMAYRDKYKTVFKDDSQEPDNILDVTNMKKGETK